MVRTELNKGAVLSMTTTLPSDVDVISLVMFLAVSPAMIVNGTLPLE